MFSGDPEVLAAGVRYLTIVGPLYGFFGLGLALYFASQGAGTLVWPLLAGFARLLIAAVGGWIAIHGLGAGLAGVFVAIAVSFVLYGVTLAVAIERGAWRRR